ncbi:hypothetical protein BDN70DRAFT_879571 [Pholiota conissans]|uniref:Uncharacterized protein n=1 Tax=Pholiota conissans TaxID=109636 RepID=A0A9P6CTS9_9AGAR|nr:hypothetical protein BDN70DRAFT_879571 [Pholiota conissans]
MIIEPAMSQAHSDSTLPSEDRLSGSTMISSRFRQSTHMIPSPGSEGKPPKPVVPLILRLPLVIGIPMVFLLMGIALEIAIFFSNHNNGFRVPQNNVFNIFGNVSGQFLASFFPTLLVLPFAFAWRELDWNIRLYQPYLVLQKGSAIAEESLFLDYTGLGPFLSMFPAQSYKHRIVFWSSFTAVLTYAFQPLTGSIFQIRQASQTDTTQVTSIKSISLASDAIADLSPFLAAAGYTDASAVLNGLGDPPFVMNGWATAEVAFPANAYLNGTMSVTTSGLQTNANCSNPAEPPTLSSPGGQSVTLTSRSVNDCTVTLPINTASSLNQYGVVDVPCPGNAASLNVTQRPVMFWFYNFAQSTTQQVKTVFCTPLISTSSVKAVASLNNGSLTGVTGLGPLVNQVNNVTGAPLNGNGFNGVIFEQSDDPFIQARANATNSIVPGAIFKAAVRNGLQETFGLANGFLDLTSLLYTRHLSVMAKAAYFVDKNSTLTASVDSLVPRLVIDPLPAHVLAIILIFVGALGIPLHLRHRSQRKRLLLASVPGTIASTVALTARSGFGELLLPYDNDQQLEKKLDGIRFRLDRRTGAIVADDYGSERVGMGRDDAMLSLLGPGGKLDTPARTPNESEFSSSSLAFQAAAGILPWERSWAPESLPRTTDPRSTEPHMPSRTEYVP